MICFTLLMRILIGYILQYVRFILILEGVQARSNSRLELLQDESLQGLHDE